jgi:glucose-1-phosphate thymidylyltransferase
MKGLILSGGLGSRLRPLTATGAKQLVPVANKPVLFYAIEQLVAAGIDDLGIVVGDTAGQVKEAVGDGSRFGATVTYLPQSQPLGLAHTVLIARDWLGQDPFCMFLGDNFLRRGITSFAETFRACDDSGMILLKHVAQPSAFGVAELDGAGRVKRLVEKPKEPVSDLAVVGVYFFGPEIHEITPVLQPSARGELEITDAIQGLIDAGHPVRAEILDDDWIDTGKKDDMLEANRLVLLDLARRIEGSLDDQSSVSGEVVIEPGATLTSSTVRGPAVIGAGTHLVDAYVGPFTAIGAHCQLTRCEIEHSIVLENSIIRDVNVRISDSLIGRNVVIEHSPLRPKAIRLMLGDHSQVGIVS